MKSKELEALYSAMEAHSAVRFPGQKTVRGVGPCDPQVMLIGEAPGEQEVLQGRPFAGKAGRNLDELLAATGIRREELFISNTVKIRPCQTGPTGRTRNRPPSREELAFFIPWLIREIALLKPGLVVTLGNTPLQALTDRTKTVGLCHGQFLTTPGGERLYCLYHPASLIYNPALKPQYQQDMAALQEWLKNRNG